jgi:hypothetical protein
VVVVMVEAQVASACRNLRIAPAYHQRDPTDYHRRRPFLIGLNHADRYFGRKLKLELWQRPGIDRHNQVSALVQTTGHVQKN